MNPVRRSRLIRRVAGGLTGVAPITTGPTAVATGPAGVVKARARAGAPATLPPGWIRHPPLPGPADAALADGMPGWQITLIATGAAVLAGRMQAARPRAAATTAHQPEPRCT